MKRSPWTCNISRRALPERQLPDLTRSKNIGRKKFTLVPGDVVWEPDEVFDFVNVGDNLSMCKDPYLELISRSS